MMKILVDTNVVYTYLSSREDRYSEESDRILTMCAEKQLEGYIAFHSLSIIWYTAKDYTEAMRRDWMRRICSTLEIVSADNKAVLAAANNIAFRDFEDNLQDCCAVTAGADYIVTANVKDYEHSLVKAVTPGELLQLLTAK